MSIKASKGSEYSNSWQKKSKVCVNPKVIFLNKMSKCSSIPNNNNNNTHQSMIQAEQQMGILLALCCQLGNMTNYRLLILRKTKESLIFLSFCFQSFSNVCFINALIHKTSMLKLLEMSKAKRKLNLAKIHPFFKLFRVRPLHKPK